MSVLPQEPLDHCEKKMIAGVQCSPSSTQSYSGNLILEEVFLLTRKTEMLSHLSSLSIIEVSLFFYFVDLKFKMTAYIHALLGVVLMEFGIDRNFKKKCVS